MSRPYVSRTLVGILTFCLLAAFAVNQSGIAATPESRLIFWAGAVFAVLVLLRRDAPLYSTPPSATILGWAVGLGALLAVTGIITDVHQFQWLGLLLMGYAGFRWSLPDIYSGNVAPALFVLYWAHPLPGNLFGGIRLALQRLSVTGAEWCLHALNIPVWADGLVLRTGMRVFEVPEACSGMNTAMIVVVCALGAGALLNLSMGQRLLLMGAGFVQVVIMNSARIALMVAASWGKPPEWSVQFLHDSTSALLLLMIALIQCEAWFWNWIGPQIELWHETRSAGRTQSRVFGERYLVPLPRLEVVAITLPLLFLLVVALFLLHRIPGQRARMIAGVATELGHRDPEQAERAAKAAALLEPGNPAHTLLVARLELMRGKHEQALARLQQLQPVPRDETVIQLMAWGLLGAGRLEEAQALLGRLSAAQAAHPGIAMCATELAIIRNDAEGAASNVVRAAIWPVLTERVRGTYPFLARHGKWSAIAGSEISFPYRDAAQFRVMLVALTAEDCLPRAMRLLESNRTLWFGKPDFLPHLQDLALRNGEKTWQQLYFDSLAQCMDRLSADELTACFEPCFLLGRPEFAWLAYRRLAVLDPGHPALKIVPARFHTAWFAFRGGAIRAISPSTTPLDLRPFLRAVASQHPWQTLLPHIPLGALMLVGPPPARISEWVDSGLAEIARRETKGTLTYQQYALYEQSLQWVGQEAEALDVLDRMARRFPDRSVEILSRRATFYRARKLWQPLYETLRQIKALRPYLDRAMQLTLAETLAHLEMGVCALELSAEAAQRGPTEQAGRLMLAHIWGQYGHFEESLFALHSAGELPPSASTAALLRKTGRYAQSALMYDMLGMAREAAYRPSALPTLPSADTVLSWPKSGTDEPPFSTANLDDQIRRDTSPFLLQLHTLTRDWLNERQRPRIADPTVWRNAGRDSLEQVTALHRFAFLSASAGNLPMARSSLDEALGLMPNARLLWRMRIAISEGDPAIVAAAHAACPSDPEIWLADLALLIRSNRLPAARQSLSTACASSLYSPASVVRAGSALLRAGEADMASMAAKYAMKQSRDYLPACLLGLEAAVALKDTGAVVALALKIADLAPDPQPFFRLAVRWGMFRDEAQLSLTRALESLIMSEPDAPEWGLRLGSLYFRNGLFDLSRRAFGKWVLAPPTGIGSGMLIMMAESARRSGDLSRSIAVLREAWRRYPDDIHVVNSLAYTLAQSPVTAAEARTFLPRLMEAPSSASILDTIAVIRMRTGEMEAVHKASKEAVARLKPGDPHWREIHLNAAEIECALGHPLEAENLLRKTRLEPHPGGSLVDKRMAELEIRILELKQASQAKRK